MLEFVIIRLGRSLTTLIVVFTAVFVGTEALRKHLRLFIPKRIR